GRGDEWRSTKLSRILTQVDANVCAMVIQPWLLHQGCWADPHRSLVQATRLLQREITRLLIALDEQRVVPVLTALLDQLRRFGGHLTHRKAHPGTDPLLEEGLDWAMTVLTSCLWVPHWASPSVARHASPTTRGLTSTHT